MLPNNNTTEFPDSKKNSFSMRKRDYVKVETFFLAWEIEIYFMFFFCQMVVCMYYIFRKKNVKTHNA